jgi:putative ABC transport system permease protein
MSVPVRLALQTLRANPLRTVLSTLGIVMGAASLAAVLSLADGAELFARRRLEGEGLQAVIAAAKTTDLIDGLRVPRAGVVRFTAADADALSAAVGPAVAVRLVARGFVRWRDAPSGRERAARAQGVFVAGAATPQSLLAGRTLGPADREASIAVVSASAAQVLAPGRPADAIDRAFFIDGRAVRVVGVLAPQEGRDEPLVEMPMRIYEQLSAPPPGEPPVLLLRADRVEQVEALTRTVERWAAARHDDAVTVSATGRQRLRLAAQGILVFKLLMGSFTAIALLVGGIGIMNVLLASVLERTREIGVRRAVGARRRDVVLQLLAESVAIAITGSLIGLAAGIGGAFAVTALMRARTEASIYAAVTPGTIVASLAAATVTGLVFGVYPALRAAKLAPVDAIRAE